MHPRHASKLSSASERKLDSAPGNLSETGEEQRTALTPLHFFFPNTSYQLFFFLYPLDSGASATRVSPLSVSFSSPLFAQEVLCRSTSRTTTRQRGCIKQEIYFRLQERRRYANDVVGENFITRPNDEKSGSKFREIFYNIHIRACAHTDG